MKTICWEGNSLPIIRSFSDRVRKRLGTGLMYLQMGELPSDAKPFKVGISGCWELRSKNESGQYRVIYVCIVKEQIHVLHCFKKTSAKTSRLDVALAQLRFKRLEQRIADEKS